MKYLLYYSLDNKFVNDQIAAQGDGKNVVSVVDGVAWTRDAEKAYYRYAPNVPEEVTTYYVTIHYKDIFGETIANDDIVPVEVYNGKGTNYCVVPKTIEGFIINQSSDTILVTGNCECELEYLSGDLKPEENPLTFIIKSDGVIRWKANNTSIRNAIQYKKNDGEWVSITSNTGDSAPSISVVAGDIVQFRGNNARYATSASYYNTFSGTTCQFKTYGNIMSLIDSEGFSTATALASSYTFNGLFAYCTGLTSSKNLILPATTLAIFCYGYMFNGCTSLTEAPELPATTLTDSCYHGLFYDCTSLTQAPVLPATTLINYCYSYMFQGCTSLTQAPSLPATALVSGCYSNMFKGCTNLIQAPELPAITLAQSCYSNMFYGCTSLISAPELPVETLATYCYDNMFYGCTSLTSAPELPATTLAESCYENMFSGCRSLTKAPELPATSLADDCYWYMFAGCTSLTEAPELPATTLTTYCYYGMFSGCTSLTSAPELPATTLASNCYQYMFSGCRNLNYIKCFATNISASDCTYGWVSSVALSGTFVKAPSMTDWSTGTSGIPQGWFVLNENALAPLKTTITGFDNKSGSTSVKIYNGTGVAWTASTQDNWISFNKTTSDEKLTDLIVSYEGNSGNQPRTGYVTITNGIDSYDITVSEIFPGEVPLTFEILSDGVIRWRAGSTSSSVTKTISYQINDGEWTEITSNTGTSAPSIDVSAGDVVRFKGDNTQYATASTVGACSCFSGITCLFNVYGNIMSLIDSTGFTTATTFENTYTFWGLFYYCNSLIDADGLVLPATTLTDYCYSNMFYCCRNLIQAPEIPAETLAGGCYQYMFGSCTNLIQGPSTIGTSATTMAGSACTSMFNGCTSLTSAPELPATTLARYCYQYMFNGCTSLTSAPEILPATTLADYCYSYMFYGCTSLTTAPSILPATTLASYCYQNMFQGCTSLTSASELPATTLADSCYYGMFAGCTSLTSAPSILPATTLTNTCYGTMFSNCTNLTSAPELPATTLASRCYSNMFNGCTSLTTAPELPATTLTDDCYRGMFYGCTNLNYIKCLATDISAGNCTENWVSGVSPSGQFELNIDSVFLWSSGTQGIPVGWILIYVGNKIKLEKDSLFFAETGGTGTVGIINNTGIGWSASTNANWLTLSTTGSAEVSATLSASVNTLSDSAETKNGTITITNGVETKIIPVTQQFTYLNKYLSFNITGDGNIVWKKASASAPTTGIYYSKNNGPWTSISASSTAGASISVVSGDTVSFKGDNTRYASSLNYYCTFSGSTARFTVCGNIMSIINSTNFSGLTSIAQAYTFVGFLRGCTGLTSAENLVLPATTLATYCYSNMFNGCTSLTQAPELPVTTLADYCYNSMFFNCTSLTQAPELPATTLASYCYQNMFAGCTGLAQAPELPATTLASYCYQYMFQGCTGLTTAPALPATALASNCYGFMFQRCTSLTQAPALPATILTDNCYVSMFSGCTSLTNAPTLPATTLVQSCYAGMFQECTSLTEAPELPATTLAKSCYSSMFRNCTSLTSAPELPAAILAENCYYYMFADCTSLNYIKCLATNISASNSLTYWVSRVASSGTFVKAASMTGWQTGLSGIPYNWTVQDATS